MKARNILVTAGAVAVLATGAYGMTTPEGQKLLMKISEERQEAKFKIFDIEPAGDYTDFSYEIVAIKKKAEKDNLTAEGDDLGGDKNNDVKIEPPLDSLFISIENEISNNPDYQDVMTLIKRLRDVIKNQYEEEDIANNYNAVVADVNGSGRVQTSKDKQNPYLAIIGQRLAKDYPDVEFNIPGNPQNPQLTNKTDWMPLGELLQNPTFKANWDNSKSLFNGEARVIVPKINAQTMGKITEAQKEAFKIAEYYYYKNRPQNLSPDDKRDFFFVITANIKYANKNENHISDPDVIEEYDDFMKKFENLMKTDPSLAGVDLPFYSETKVTLKYDDDE